MSQIQRCLSACLMVFFFGGSASAGYIEGVPYFHQFSNRINPSGSCQNTCVAMVLKYYGAADITPDMISSKWGTSVAQATGGLKSIFNEEAALRGLRVRDRSTEDGTLSELHQALDAGKPVIVHGGFSTVGHLMVLVGYDARYYYAMDPASKWTEQVNGGFTNTDDADIGRYTRYGRESVENAILSSDHRRLIRMHIPYFEPGPLEATWEGAWTDTAVAGGRVRLEGDLAVRAEGEGAIGAWADLSALGGPSDQVLSLLGDGAYRFDVEFEARSEPGSYAVPFILRQGEWEEKITRRIVLVPPSNASILGDTLGESWTQGFLLNASLAWQEGTVFGGEKALAVDANAFTIEFKPEKPIALSGYRALRFSFHPGEVTAGWRPAFSVQLNTDARKIEPLLGDAALLDDRLDLVSPTWQTVDIPLWAFHPLEDPLESIRFFGNLRGVFFIDNIELISARFPPPHVRGEWVGDVPDSVMSGQVFQWEQDIRVFSTELGGDTPEVVADLTDFGGAAEHRLEPLGDGLYRLRTFLKLSEGNGLREVVVHIRQSVGEEFLQGSMHHRFLLLPREDQVVFDEGYGGNWDPGFLSNASVFDARDTTYVGSLARGVEARAFTIEFLPRVPVEAAGYRALRFAFHPGFSEVGSRPAFNVMVNEDAPSQVLLLDAEEPQIDMTRREWQQVEIPLRRFYRMEGPITSLRLLGNLRGTFYLDDVRLVAEEREAIITAVREETDRLPARLSLRQNWPNPFNSETVICFSLVEGKRVDLSVFNVSGQRVAVLAAGRFRGGEHTLHWDGSDARGRPLATGMYIARLQTAQRTVTRKMLLLR